MRWVVMNVADVSRWISELETTRFFGCIEIKFEAGRVVLVRKIETLKSIHADCGTNPGEKHAKANP